MLQTTLAILLPFAAIVPGLRSLWYLAHVAIVAALAWQLGEAQTIVEFSKEAFRNLLLLHLIVINPITILLYYWDKRSATRGGWRVPEKQLHAFAFIGGTLGAFIAKRLFNHKLKKGQFVKMFWAVVVMQLWVIGALYIFVLR